MVNGKPRLSVQEIKQVVDNVKNYGGTHITYIGSYGYCIDDIYEQYLYNLDALMGVLDEVILKKGRL